MKHYLEMSMEELWNLHETIAAELTRKMQLEKRKLEDRLPRISSDSDSESSKRERRPIRRFLPNIVIRKIRKKLGRAVANNHAGWRLSYTRARSWISF